MMDTKTSIKTSTDDDEKEAIFHARQSARVSASTITTDHDKWIEHLAVVDMLVPNSYIRNGEAKYELQIRSFFVSTKTGKKTWDEPPSGAETIEYANEEVRSMAEAQKRDLELVQVPENSNTDNGNSKNRTRGNRIMNLMKRRKKNGQNNKNDDNEKDISKYINVKKGSNMDSFLNVSEEMPPYNDYYLEYALANSMTESTDLEMVIARSINNTRSSQEITEEEELALATAMSLSMNDLPPCSNDKLSDDIEEEKIECTSCNKVL